MALSDLVAQGLDRPVAAIRRHAISLAVTVAAAICAIGYLASATVMLIEIPLGPIGARLAVAALLVVLALAGYFAPRLLAPSSRPVAPQASSDVEGLSRDQRIAMIFEALLLGFSMGSRKPAETANSKD